MNHPIPLITSGVAAKKLHVTLPKLYSWLAELRKASNLEHSRSHGLFKVSEEYGRHLIPEDFLQYYPEVNPELIAKIIEINKYRLYTYDSVYFQNNNKSEAVVYLPGNSVSNFEEGSAIVRQLVDDNLNVYFQKWDHWKVESTEEFNAFNYSEDLVIDLKKNRIKEISIVAKSIGTYTTLKLIPEARSRGVAVNKVVLMGLPLNDLNKEDEQEYLNILGSYPGPITVIQNSNDSHGSGSAIQEFLKEIDCKIIIKESDTHKYPYVGEVWEIVKGQTS